jgi:hypothetical protein
MAGKDSGVVNAVIVLAALGVLLYAAWCYSSHRNAPAAHGPSMMGAPALENFDLGNGPPGDVAMPLDPAAEPYKPVDFQQTVDGVSPADCFPRDRLSAEDLLPKDAANSKWAQVNPAGQGDVGDQNYLASGYHQGVDTIGGTLRNANLQLRSEPPCPRSRVSIWNESTIEPDLNRRPFEIDGSC